MMSKVTPGVDSTNSMYSPPTSPDSALKYNKAPGSAASTGGGGGNMKVRIGYLEDALEDQLRKNDMIDSRLDQNMNEMDLSNERMLLKMQENKDKFDDALNNLRKEFGHKFELQMAENQRTQQHIASLKADKSALQRKLAATVERLRAVEREVTGEDLGPEDDFLANGGLGSTGGGGSGSGMLNSSSSTTFGTSPNRDGKSRG